jgi:hypothetical protein
MNTIVYLRNSYVSIFKKKVILFEKDNNIINNFHKRLLYNALYYLNFKNTLKSYKINYIYECDDLIFYENNKPKKYKIGSIITDVIIKTQYENIDITENFKKYSLNIPMYIFILLEKLNSDDEIIITSLVFGKKKEKEYKLNDVKYKTIYDLL